MQYFYVLPILIILFNIASCAKILGIWPTPGHSQFILGQALMAELARRGHEVSVISEFEPKEKIKNYETIKLPKTGGYEGFDLLNWPTYNLFSLQKSLLDGGLKYSGALFEKKIIQELIDSNRTFDLVIVENFSNEAHMAFAEHFKAPLIVFSSQPVSDWNYHFVGNVKLPSISPFFVSPFDKHMSFYERFRTLLLSVYDFIYKELIYYPGQQALVDKYFPNKMDLKKIVTNTEMMLLFSHPLTTGPSLTTSAIVEVGGFQIVSKKLPNDIQSVLDGAKNGAVLVSLGTNVECSSLSKEQFNMFLNAFKKFPQRFLWKCPVEIPNKPDNVYLFKWMPQTDILAHPNTIAFITHNGLLSTTEAIHYGVPMISIPVFCDQMPNAIRVQKNGIGERLSFLDLTENDLYEAIKKVTTNTSYKEKMQRVSKMFRDQPSKPLDRAMHTIEYVLKYKPGPLLRSPALSLWWFQLYMLDVLLFIFVSIVLLYLFISIILRKLMFSKKQNKRKTA
ncbi:unnamed protein product [Psylliodes chrysocephalus]|uniref:UDP-glucuronosyltransferase n=1 Tax=Psylliodes chrysocephalus TaxID=3402493 RepID=A0A9P0CLC4_9CUCU|nr:unnamed protein product [Psylliodes chrysocephala]